MGREIRRVPEGWEHPRYTHENVPVGLSSRIGGYMPLLDEPFTEAMREWVDAWEAWERGERPDYCSDKNRDMDFWEWDGGPPDPGYHRPQWSDDEATHFQYYETVSEGTPLSPPMPSLEALADWLCSNLDEWGKGPMSREAAEAFCKSGWAPSMVMKGGHIAMGAEGLLLAQKGDDSVEVPSE